MAYMLWIALFSLATLVSGDTAPQAIEDDSLDYTVEANPIYTEDPDLLRQRFLDLRRRIELKMKSSNKTRCYQCYYSPPRMERHLVQVKKRLENGDYLYENQHMEVKRKETWDKCRGPLTKSFARRYGVSLGHCWDNCYVRFDSKGNILRGCYRGEYGVNPKQLGCHYQMGYLFCFCTGNACNSEAYIALLAEHHIERSRDSPDVSLPRENTAVTNAGSGTGTDAINIKSGETVNGAPIFVEREDLGHIRRESISRDVSRPAGKFDPVYIRRGARSRDISRRHVARSDPVYIRRGPLTSDISRHVETSDPVYIRGESSTGHASRLVETSDPMFTRKGAITSDISSQAGSSDPLYIRRNAETGEISKPNEASGPEYVRRDVSTGDTSRSADISDPVYIKHNTNSGGEVSKSGDISRSADMHVSDPVYIKQDVNSGEVSKSGDTSRSAELHVSDPVYIKQDANSGEVSKSVVTSESMDISAGDVTLSAPHGAAENNKGIADVGNLADSPSTDFQESNTETGQHASDERPEKLNYENITQNPVNGTFDSQHQYRTINEKRERQAGQSSSYPLYTGGLVG